MNRLRIVKLYLALIGVGLIGSSQPATAFNLRKHLVSPPASSKIRAASAVIARSLENHKVIAAAVATTALAAAGFAAVLWIKNRSTNLYTTGPARPPSPPFLQSTSYPFTTSTAPDSQLHPTTFTEAQPLQQDEPVTLNVEENGLAEVFDSHKQHLTYVNPTKNIAWPVANLAENSTVQAFSLRGNQLRQVGTIKTMKGQNGETESVFTLLPGVSIASQTTTPNRAAAVITSAAMANDEAIDPYSPAVLPPTNNAQITASTSEESLPLPPPAPRRWGPPSSPAGTAETTQSATISVTTTTKAADASLVSGTGSESSDTAQINTSPVVPHADSVGARSVEPIATAVTNSVAETSDGCCSSQPSAVAAASEQKNTLEVRSIDDREAIATIDLSHISKDYPHFNIYDVSSVSHDMKQQTCKQTGTKDGTICCDQKGNWQGQLFQFDGQYYFEQFSPEAQKRFKKVYDEQGKEVAIVDPGEPHLTALVIHINEKAMAVVQQCNAEKGLQVYDDEKHPVGQIEAECGEYDNTWLYAFRPNIGTGNQHSPQTSAAITTTTTSPAELLPEAAQPATTAVTESSQKAPAVTVPTSQLTSSVGTNLVATSASVQAQPETSLDTNLLALSLAQPTPTVTQQQTVPTPADSAADTTIPTQVSTSVTAATSTATTTTVPATVITTRTPVVATPTSAAAQIATAQVLVSHAPVLQAQQAA